jgi:ferredoxin
MIIVNDYKCDYCGTCVGVCPENCINLAESQLLIDKELCTVCMKCVLVCPVEALYQEGTKVNKGTEEKG